jgi:hypothetical protein
MTAKTWAVTALLLSLGQAPGGQAPGDVPIYNQRSVSVPVDIQEARRAEVRELLLFASTDQGRTWQQVASMPPNQPAFTFTAPIDGTYWLRVAAINRQNKQEPDNLYQGHPDQKMIIDTMKPLLRILSPQRQGDEIALAWELREDNPDWTSFRLEYQPKDGSTLAWTPIQATPGLTGQARFRPATPVTVAVRLSFTDKAGNQAFTLADVPGVAVQTTAFNNPPGGAANAPPPMFPGAPAPVVAAPGSPPTTPLATAAPVSAAPTLAPNPSAPLPPVTPPVAAEAPQLPPLPAHAAPLPNAVKTFPQNPPAPNWNPSGASPEPTRVVASTDNPPPPRQAVADVLAAKRSLPPLQYVSHPEITLEYELARVGPSGVGSIDLWWTKDDGQNWELYAIDPEGKSGNVANGRHKRTVALDHGEGLYGFTLVVKSRAGLGKAPPRAGDAPEIRVELDTTPPVAQLYSPAPEPGKYNTLQLKWAARDANLTGTPVTLEWAAKRDGPWQAIAPPLANDGTHAWQLPDGLPVQVYLRLRVRDLAGNESVAVTPEPQLVDLSEPEGRLINVSVTPR